MKTFTLSCPSCGNDLEYRVNISLNDSKLETEYDSILSCPNRDCIYSDFFPQRTLEILELDLDLLLKSKFSPTFK